MSWGGCCMPFNFTSQWALNMMKGMIGQKTGMECFSVVLGLGQEVTKVTAATTWQEEEVVKMILSTTWYAEQVFSDHKNRKRVVRLVGEHVDMKGSDKNVFSGRCFGLHRWSSAVPWWRWLSNRFGGKTLAWFYLRLFVFTGEVMGLTEINPTMKTDKG